MSWYLKVLRQYADFGGRARRMEYWMFVLVSAIVFVVLGVIDAALGTYVLGTLYGLAVLIPGLAVTVRRLHDTGRSGWWLLIGFVPMVGLLILLVLMILESQPGSNPYGPNPTTA